MPKAIKAPRKRLPIKPTGNPKPGEVIAVAQEILEIAQLSILNPAAVISALKCAEATYCTNAESKGMDPETIEHSQVLGLTLSKVILKAHNEKSSTIVTPDSRLVDASGAPIVSELPEQEPDPVVEEQVPQALYRFATSYSEEDKCFVASVEEMPDLKAVGPSPIEALLSLREVMEAAAKDIEANGDALPEPTAVIGEAP